MPRWLWRDGRMSWGVIGAVGFVTVSLIAFDLGWRLLKLPFERLLIGGVLIDLAAAVALIALVRVAVRRHGQR